jgi:predicted CXXCH cytochrome family protein
MRRKKPFLSPLSLIFSIVLLSFLGGFIWYRGGLAFSPGDLSDKSYPDWNLQGFVSHADFEKECQFCHQPFESLQADLCMHCHTDIADQINTKTGLHAALDNPLQCAACHSDHRGRAFDMLLGALDRFDHTISGFNLIWHQIDFDSSPMECAACHPTGQDYAVSDQVCTDCHEDHDVAFTEIHRRDYGSQCLACHDGADQMANFDHGTASFPLEGKHLATRCAECHLDGHFEETSIECSACHSDPNIHLDLFNKNCTECHSTENWTPALLDGKSFSHDVQARFSLVRHSQDYEERGLSCQDCHQNDLDTFDPKTCTSCHASHDADFMNEHQARFGENCLDCHDGLDRMSDFDHSNVFLLEGRHAEIDCKDCHEDNAGNKVFKNTPTECSQCHADPEIHAGSFGLKCEYCHSAEAWTPANLKTHPFPLDHGAQGDQDCQVCHAQAYTEFTCYGCHDHQPEAILESHVQVGIAYEELPNCFDCHPNGLIEESQPGK